MNKETDKIPDYLFHIAQGFYDVGYHVAFQVKKDNSYKGFQRLPTAVVNFSFAIELFLKGLHLITTGKDLKGHQFWNLYKQLPISIKSDIEERYSEHKSKKDKELSAYKIVVTQMNNSEGKNHESNDNLTVKELLKLHNKSFENWRYLYEVKSEGYEYEYNFDLMDCFIKALIELINEIRSRKKPSFILNHSK